MQAYSVFTPQRDVGFDEQLNSTNGNFDSLKKVRTQNEKENVFAHVSFGK